MYGQSGSKGKGWAQRPHAPNIAAFQVKVKAIALAKGRGRSQGQGGKEAIETIATAGSGVRTGSNGQVTDEGASAESLQTTVVGTTPGAMAIPETLTQLTQLTQLTPEPTIHVSGCSNETVSNIIQGLYNTKESNHGKPVYKKEGPQGSVTVLIYYWDERDGPSFNGWWFGPKVGGDQVWAYNAGNLGRENAMPPTSNWKVPWDGKVDEKLRISVGAPRRDPRDRERDLRDKREEEKRRREEEERRQREEARRRRQREEEQQREQARREAEARRRRQEEERKQEEAANNVREVLKKLRNATPDNLKSLQADLDKAAASNFQAMGALRDRVNDEMQHTITQVQKRIAEELKQREEAERRRQMELARVEQLLKEAAAEVQSTEARVTQAQEATTLACQRGIDAEAAPEDILQAVQEAGKILEDAKGLLDRSERLLSVKKEAMGAGEGARHVKREVDDLTDRLQQSHRSLQRCTETLEETRGRGLRRAAALKQDQDWMAAFKRHDVDDDGQLSSAEVEAYARENGVELSGEVLSRIMRVLEPVTFEKFLRLRQKVGIAKFEAEARTRRAAEEEQQREAEAQRLKVQEMVEVITAQFEDGKLKLQQVSEELKSLEASASSEDVRAGTEKAESQGREVREMLDAISRQLEEATQGFPPFEREPKLKKEVFRLQEQHRILEVQLEKVLGHARASKEAVAKKAQAETLELRARAVAALRARMSAEGQSGEALFEASAGAGGLMELESFQELLKDLAPAAPLERLFVSVAGAKELDKATFLDLIRLYFKCVKGTVLSEDISIKSKTVRRLEVGEVLEVLEGPSKEDGANVQRVRCLALQDCATGWATIAGNQGTPFLIQELNPEIPKPAKASVQATGEGDVQEEGEVLTLDATEDADTAAEEVAEEEVAEEAAEVAEEEAAAEPTLDS
ncbi:LanA [Symbiodinium microadriaticum]|nr:LanA [Symbiodinium microadriaticum]